MLPEGGKIKGPWELIGDVRVGKSCGVVYGAVEIEGFVEWLSSVISSFRYRCMKKEEVQKSYKGWRGGGKS
jgi:hypothetical protein